jgi:hypothetical protein
VPQPQRHRAARQGAGRIELNQRADLGQANDFNHWRQLGNVGWSFDDVLPYFRKAERPLSGHGREGPPSSLEHALREMRLNRRPAPLKCGVFQIEVWRRILKMSSNH